MNPGGLPMTTLLDDTILPRNVANILADKIGDLLNLEELTFNDAVVTPEGEWFRVNVDFNPPELQLTPFGPGAITIGVPSGEPVIVDAFFSDEKIDLLLDVTIIIALPPALLRRVESHNGNHIVDLTCHSRIGIRWSRIEGWQMSFELLHGLTLPLSEIATTCFQVSADDVRPSIIPGSPIAQVIAAGFDSDFIGIYARSARLFLLPAIQIHGWVGPGLRLALENVVIGNQGVTLEAELSWPVAFDANGNFLPQGTELLGYLADEEWQIALSNLSGAIRHNVPENFGVRAYLRVPFFDAIFSTFFSFSSAAAANGSIAYQTEITIVKESGAPIVGSFLDAGLILTLNNFSASGLLSDAGFSIGGQAGFAINLFGFELEAQSVAVSYTHQGKSDHFEFTLDHVVLGELGTVEEAKLVLKSHRNEQGGIIFDQVQISAASTWANLRNLIPPDLCDILELPEDVRIEALLTWQEAEGQGEGSRKLVVRLLTEVSHLDRLWTFIPVQFRPEVRRLRSMFKLVYDSAEQFNPADDQGNPLPPPQAYTQRSGVLIELSALMEVKPPDLDAFNLPNFDLISVDTGAEDGFVAAEFRSGYSSDSESGEQFQAGLTVQRPIAVRLSMPGTDPASPFIDNTLTNVGLQFSYADADEEEMAIGGKLYFEGDFSFRPLVPADMPFGPSFNQLLRKVGLDEISGHSTLSVTFTEDRFDFACKGEFADFGIEIDIFELMASLATSNERPNTVEVEIDFDIGFQLTGFSFKIGTRPDSQDPDERFYFEFKLGIECTMAGLPPLKTAIALSSDAFSFGLENLTIPLEVPRYPIDSGDLASLQGTGGIWSCAALSAYEMELDMQIDALEQLLAEPAIPAREEFRLLKEKSHLELKKLLLQLVMAIHQRVGPSGQPVYQGLIEIDTWAHATFLNALHLDTALKLHFPGIAFRIPFDEPSGIELSGTGHIVGFADDDPLKSLEAYFFTLGLSSEYIFCKIESSGEPIPIPSFGTRYDDGSLSISKFMIGYGFTKNSFAVDFAGEIVIPSELIADADTSAELGAGVRLPHHNKLAFKLDLIPVSIGKATVIIPLPQFDLDLRTPSAPALVGTARCRPYWDGLEFIIHDVMHSDFKHLAFSPFFGFAIIPNLKFDGDLVLGDDTNGLTLIVDDMLVLIGAYLGASHPLPIPFFAEPTQPYFQNICVNLRALGFQINFNMQRPFPSFSPLALFEAFGLISNPMMEIDPHGSLANTIRFTLSDACVRVPDFVLQMFPDTANFMNRSYGFTLNLGTLITMSQAVFKAAEAGFQVASEFIRDRAAGVEDIFRTATGSFDSWDWITLLPPELRKFRTGGHIAGFEAGACIVLATGSEARDALTNKDAPKTPLPALTVDRQSNAHESVIYSKHDDTLLTLTNGHRFQTSWTREGIAAGRWEKTEHGIARTENANGISYFVHKSQTIPRNFNLSVTIGDIVRRAPSSAGIVCCYVDSKNHYVLRTLLKASGEREVVIERRKSHAIAKIGGATIPCYDSGDLKLELTTYLQGTSRTFIVRKITEAKRRGQDQETEAFSSVLFEAREDEGIERGRLGLYVKNQAAHFSMMKVHRLTVEKAGFGRIGESSQLNGFKVSLPASQLDGRRLIDHDESATLFKGIEFNKFDEQYLSRIPVDKLEHIDESEASIYIGAYMKVFSGQRFRFLGRMFADGSFALVSEAESKPLRLSVLGIRIQLPFRGYGNLLIAGRQKRNGCYGYIEANGNFDWSPIPNIVRIRVGDGVTPASLRLHSDGRFALTGTAVIELFNGAATMAEGSIAITDKKAAFDGMLAFEPGSGIAGYPFKQILKLEIAGAGSIEGSDRFRFRGRGDVCFLGQLFSSVNVEVDEQYARFDVRFRKPVASKTELESRFPILSSCDIDLRGSCEFRMRRTVRPEFRLAGEGRINVLGAAIEGKGDISSLPQKNQSLKKDVFHANMEGNLLWQGRKWLGAKLSIGSTGLSIAGTTNLGLKLTPHRVAGMDIANLFLNIQLDGEFKLDAQKSLFYFLFKGHWMLGAAMPGTGNPARGGNANTSDNRQILPLASSEFSFSSGAGPASGSQYCLELFHIDGFAFLPFKDAKVPIPTVTLSRQEGAITLIRTGKTDTNPPIGVVEFTTPLGVIGLEGGILPYLGAKSLKPSGLHSIYSAYDVDFSATEMNVNFDVFSNVKLSLCLDDDADANFPLRLKLDSPGGPKYFPN